jgi:hypothetical protein
MRVNAPNGLRCNLHWAAPQVARRVVEAKKE